MTRDDIINMVWESGTKDKMGALHISRIELEAFAIFIEEAEREACALVCEELPYPGNSDWQCGTLDCAVAIRARGEQ